MPRFPDAVITAMHHANTTVTCMPVKLDEGNGDWESAVFFVLPPDIDSETLGKLFPSSNLFPIELEADLREHENGTLIELGVAIDTGLIDRLQGVVMFLTGHIASHHEAVALLAQQDSIGLFLGDVHCNLLHQQRIPLANEHREVFAELLQEALKRDSLIRMTGKYDPEKVFDSVAGEA